LEWKHTYEDVALFRVISNAYFKRNKAHIQKMKLKKEQELKKDQGFFSKMFTSGPAIKVESLAITPSLLRELQDNLSQEDLKPTLPQTSDDFVQQKITFCLSAGSFTLKDSEFKPLAEGGFRGLTLRVDKRNQSLTVKYSLGTVKVVDHFTPNTSFPNIVEQINPGEDMLSGLFDIKPIDNKNLDYRVAIGMEPINVVLPKQLLDRVVSFFSRPLIAKNSFKDLELAATIKFQQLKQQTQVQFKEMIGDQKAIEVNVDIAAPNIIIPHKPSDRQSPLLILVLGHLTMSSDLDSTYQAMKQAQEGITEEDASEILLYKRYKLDLKEVHAMISSIDDFNARRQQELPRGVKLIDKFDVDLSLGLCRAHSEKRALLKLEACLPELNGYLSSGKVTNILLILDAITASDAPPPSEEEMSLDQILQQVAQVCCPLCLLCEKLTKRTEREREKRRPYSP
jgi:vacuolar protein sorting-associated protein 13A/C